MFPELWVRGEPCVTWVGAGSCRVSPRAPHGDGAVGFGAVGCAFIPPTASPESPSMELGGPAPTPLPEGRGWPCPHGFSLALAGECGKLRSCEVCTASSHSHNGTDCVWVGCRSPEEPGEGLGWWAQRGSPCHWTGAVPGWSWDCQTLRWMPTLGMKPPHPKPSGAQGSPGPEHHCLHWFGILGKTLLPLPTETGSCVQRGAAVRETCALYNTSTLCRGNPRPQTPPTL